MIIRARKKFATQQNGEALKALLLLSLMNFLIRQIQGKQEFPDLPILPT